MDIRLTGGNCPIHLSGKEFQAHPLTDLDYVELDEYVQDQMLEIARRNAKNYSGEERQEVLRAAISAASGVRWTSEEGAKILATKKGLARLAYQMVKSNHKKLGFPEFLALCLDQSKEAVNDNIIEIDRVFIKLNVGDKIEEKTESKNE